MEYQSRPSLGVVFLPGEDVRLRPGALFDVGGDSRPRSRATDPQKPRRLTAGHRHSGSGRQLSATGSICCSPLDKVPAIWRRRSASTGNSARRCDRLRSQSRRARIA